MSNAPLMPKQVAVWLIENTALTFQQIADFCHMHMFCDIPSYIYKCLQNHCFVNGVKVGKLITLERHRYSNMLHNYHIINFS